MSTYTSIATQTLGSSASSVTFSNIPQNYSDLILVFSGVGGNNISLRFNDDTTASYSVTRIQGDGSTAGSSRYNNITSMYGPYSATQNTTIWQIQNYTNASLYKTALAKGGGAGTQVELYTGLWQKRTPITSITVITPSANMSSGSTISIYGVAAGNSSAKADGGNIVTTDGTYWYHMFTSSGTFTPKQSLTVDYLVVAGGGGGGAYGGGGGAGGLRSTVGSTGGSGSLESALSLTANNPYITIIGAGGAGGTNGAAQSGSIKGIKGSDSVFSSITSTGGGSGLGFNENTSSLANGGSGGGGIDAPGSGQYINGGTGTSNQGYAGGRGYRTGSGYNAGGGGGGAGSVGSDGGGSGSSPIKGAGGSGRTISISGSSITYATGGSGMQESGSDTAGANGNFNTGSGGDSSVGVGATRASGGNGGSGVVVIRYAV